MEYQEVSTWTYPHWHEDISVTAGRNLDLNIVFTNTFPELTITLNAGNIGKYFFGSADNVGDLFFPNYVRSLNINPAWPQPSGNENGAFGDPCKLMTPLNTWRLPKQTEIQESLFQIYGITSPSQSNQNTYSNGSSIYFGIRQYPGSELSNYFSLNFRAYGKDTGYYGFETDKGRY